MPSFYAYSNLKLLLLLLCLFLTNHTNEADQSESSSDSSKETTSNFANNNNNNTNNNNNNGDDDESINDLFQIQTGVLLDIGESTKVYYSFKDKIPLYAIEKLDCSRFTNREVRRRKKYFALDERIPAIFRGKSEFYHDDESLDRAHMAPTGDFLYSKDDYKASFKYSNVFPQNSDLNRNIWTRAETLARDLIIYQGLDSLYVYTGNGTSVEQKHRGGSFEKIIPIMGDRTGMSVPDFVFKIFFGIKNQQSFIFSFLLNNESIEFSSNALTKHSVSVEELEAMTGFVFPDLLKSTSNESLCEHFRCALENRSSFSHVNLCQDSDDDFDD